MCLIGWLTCSRSIKERRVHERQHHTAWQVIWRLKFDIEKDPVTGERRCRTVTVRGKRQEAEAELPAFSTRPTKGRLLMLPR